MKIRAQLQNRQGSHHVVVKTGNRAQQVDIPPKAKGMGSSLNGGEVLFTALATCYCNDIFREAGKRGIKVRKVEVEVEGDFPAAGEPAQHVTYRARVDAEADEQAILDLMRHTDTVAEIHNTLRLATPVELRSAEAVHL